VSRRIQLSDSSTDPHFLVWPRDPAHPQNIHNNCFSYAVGDVETINNYADRTSDVLRQPEPGDAIGMPAKIYTPAHGFNAQSIRTLAIMTGLQEVSVSEYEPLPLPERGQRLVAMVFLTGQDLATTQYHWLRQGPDRLFTAHIPEQGPSDRDVRGRLIRDPRHSYFSRNQQGPYFFLIPEQGLPLKMQPPWDRLITNLHDQRHSPSGQRAQAAIFNEMAALVDRVKFPVVKAKLEKLARLGLQGT